MKIILIDHNDSFTYNIVEVLRHIKNCEVQVVKYDKITIELINRFDKIIFSPGPGLPTDYIKTNKIIDTFFRKKPILGICLGQQIICSYFGANLYNMETIIHGVKKEIHIATKSKLFKNVPAKTEVGLYHSWAVSSTKFPKNLLITSTGTDGTIMSVEHEKYPLYGIQFHPESFLTEYGIQILKNFIEL